MREDQIRSDQIRESLVQLMWGEVEFRVLELEV